MELPQIRQEIDRIDAELLRLLCARMDCAQKVAEVKQQTGTPVLNAAREEEILQRVAEKAGRYGGAARVVYTDLLSESRGLQYAYLQADTPLRRAITSAPEAPGEIRAAACLGGAGSYSHEALLNLCPGASPVFFSDFGDIFRSVARGETDAGIVPVENSTAGSVSGVYALLMQYRFSIIAAQTRGVRHCLANRSGDPRDIRAVYSKEIALRQCSQKLEALGLPLKETASTSEAAAFAAAHPEAAAVCSRAAAKENGLHIVEHDFQNAEQNRTRFVVFQKALSISPDAQKIAVSFHIPHRTGSLNAVLSRFAAAGMNLTKIESRPTEEPGFQYEFYLDFTGNVHTPAVLELLCALDEELPRFAFLGNYRETQA